MRWAREIQKPFFSVVIFSVLIRKFSIQWSTSLKTCHKVSHRLGWDMKIACYRNAEKWLEIRTALLDIRSPPEQLLYRVFKSGRDCYILLPLHLNPIFYCRLIVSAGKIKQIQIISVDLICKIPHLFHEVLGKLFRARLLFCDICNFICPPSKCQSSWALPVLLCQLNGQC